MEKTKFEDIFELSGRTIRLKAMPTGAKELRLPKIAQNEIDKDFMGKVRAKGVKSERYPDGYCLNILSSEQKLACQDYVYGSAELDCNGLENLSGAKIFVPSACSLALKCDERKPLKLCFVLPKNMKLYIVNQQDRNEKWESWELIAHQDLEDYYEFDGSDGYFLIEPYSKRYSANKFSVAYPKNENE